MRNEIRHCFLDAILGNLRMIVIPFPFPLKVKWVIAGSIALELFSAIATTNDGVAHLAHLGGMLFGYILIKYWRKRDRKRVRDGVQEFF